MPNKTIYVSEDDLPLFERAQEVAGDNLSSAIVRALRRFIEVEEARQGGFDEITVLVGAGDGRRRVRFLGARLVRWLQKNPTGKGIQVLSVCRTARGRLALHTHTIPDWKYSWGDPDPRSWGIWGSKLLTGGWDRKAFEESGDYSFEVFESLEELAAHLPDNVYRAVSQATEGPPLEDLDI